MQLKREKGEVDVLQRLKDLVDVIKDISEEEFTSIKRWLINISAPLLPAGKKKELERIIEESKPWEVENMISNFAKNINRLREEAKEKGLAEGKKERDLEIAEKLLAKDMEVVEIMEITGLDKDKIEEIKKKAQH
ncbi:hypothetical protein [Fuchsiella alkaliacetigena]|uniref:hypothetical protein n=1 Tax=Fuchsiella alkaliacetigena TaxID=957042 RepID=UPI00200A8A7F|nr:hypothetical protein [Fuchsiella alkaliacetigena]MCK8826123.1 hypothetical protein [Fuchsiella alkaliacetigena]